MRMLRVITLSSHCDNNKATKFKEQMASTQPPAHSQPAGKQLGILYFLFTFSFWLYNCLYFYQCHNYLDTHLLTWYKRE